MVVQDMTAAEYTQIALDLLVHADDALMARDYDNISPTLWSAVEHAIAAAAVERGWTPPVSDEKAELFAIVARIEEERGEDLTDYYDSASMHYDNARYTFLEDSEHEFFAPSARRFITKLLKLYGWNIRNGRMRKVSREIIHDCESG